MADINSYANDLLLDFLDAAHEEIRARLEAEMGDDWLAQGVERHLAPGYFARTREMLESPMRIVDMNKADEELYGVEHLSNIVTGNWKLFGARARGCSNTCWRSTDRAVRAATASSTTTAIFSSTTTRRAPTAA